MENKFELKPFDKVLVRNDDNWKWNGELFLRYVEDNKFQYECLTTSYSQCIPYEGNEHLLGTTDAPDFFEEKKETEEANDNYGYEASFFKKGDVVLVRNKDGQNWLPEIYVEYRNDSFDCRNYDYEQCIPYEGNEHLLDTTDKPEQRSQSKNTLFGIELKPGYVLEFDDGEAGILFPLRVAGFPKKEKFAIIYMNGRWYEFDSVKTERVVAIHGFASGCRITSGEVLWKRP